MSIRVLQFPHWLRDLDANLPVTRQFVIHGNIRDRHLLPPTEPGASPPRLLDTVGALWTTLQASDFDLLLYHTPMHGLRVFGTEGAQQLAAGMVTGTAAKVGKPTSYEDLAAVLRKVDDSGETPPRFALVIDYVSQQQPAVDPPEDGLQLLMLTALSHVHHGRAYLRQGARTAAIHNPVVWLVDRPSDLPAWLVSGSDGIRQIPVPTPTIDLRLRAAELLARLLPGTDPRAQPDPEVVRRFAESSDGLTVRAMTEVGQLARDGGIPAARIEDTVRAYRVGLLDDPWKAPGLRERIRHGEPVLNTRVKGQPRAVRHASDVLIRTTMALSGSFQGTRASGPRGVMFFAGPTGVGKTELAKAITALVFGNDQSYVRFDMSEFASEHSEARLIGAPPGFIGHGGGGELTNAVRQHPFSLVLFDEIEKAHPRILDKFLQILSDGRLTDGSGSTVHFSETIIVFTSNLGVRDVRAQGDAPEERSSSFEHAVTAAVQREFREGLNRPELLGRIGDNIVVFDYLSEDTGRELVGDFLGNVLMRIQAEHGITVTIDDQVARDIADRCTADMSLGGRGVGQVLESAFVNPLARALVQVDGSTEVRVSDLLDRGGWIEVILQCG